MSGAPHGAGLDIPRMIEMAADRYRTIAAIDPPTEARGFATHCAACKAALAHLEQLIRFGQFLAAGQAGDRLPAPDLAILIAEARAALPANDTETETDVIGD